MSILIADSGATTAEWALITDDSPTQLITTTGINPVHQHDETIQRIIADELCTVMRQIQPRHIYFYGAGCIGDKTNRRLTALLTDYFPNAVINIASDLLGAARSLCCHEEGIAGILGTGANSCHYDGKSIVSNIPPLGYILGDEGSGAAMGKEFLRRLLRNELDPQITREFYAEYETDYSHMIDRIYRQPAANRYLASLSPFIAAHIAHGEIYAIVHDAIRSYFEHHIMRYDYRHLTVHLTGSVAYHYADVIRDVAEEKGIKIGHITATPIAGLTEYHNTNNIL